MKMTEVTTDAKIKEISRSGSVEILIEGVQKVFALAKKLAINKKSTVVVQS